MRRFDSRFIHFETPEAGLVEDPGLGAATPPEPAAAPEPVAPEAQPWEAPIGTLGDHISQLAQGQQELYELLQPEQPAPDPNAGPEWDPLDPDSVRNFIQHEARQLSESMFQERVGPFEHVLGTVAEQQGEQIARNEFETIEKELGSFNHDQALTITQGLISAGVEPLQAVQVAAQRQHAFEAELRATWEAEAEAHRNSLLEAPVEPGPATGGALEQPAAPANPHEAAQRGGPSRYEEIGRAVIERQRPLTAA